MATATRSDRAHRAAKRYIYAWGAGTAEANGTMKDLLGGKGAGLAEMTSSGLPTPTGFTITTDACRAYMAAGKRVPEGLDGEVGEHIAALEARAGKRFGDPSDPLLVSVRSGAKISMPGMMDTVLNLGLNDVAVEGQAKMTGNPRFVKLPMIFILGVAYDIIELSRDSNHRLTVAAEYVKPNDGRDKWNVGVEYLMFSSVYFRGGYRFNYDEERNYTFGIGIQYSIEDDFTLKLDYAYADVGRFSYVNMLTFGFGL